MTTIACASVTAPAKAQLHAKPISANTAYELRGFAIEAPAGDGWFELRSDESNAYFGKKLRSPTHSFIAVATSATLTEAFVSPGELLEHVTRMQSQDQTARGSIVESHAELDTAPRRFCVRHYTRAQDREAVHAMGKPLEMETFGLSCLHPDYLRLLVDVSYTERGLPGEASPELKAEGEGVIRSLAFRPF